MSRSHLSFATVRVPTKRVRAEAIRAKLADFDEVADKAAMAEYLGTPTLADDDHFLISTNMQAAAYTLDETAPPAGDPPRNVIITHTQVGGVTDTLGDATVVGTDVNDEVITEVLTVADGSTVKGTKAFKTITSVTTPDWVIDTVEDTIEVGFDTLIGLSIVLASAAAVFMATLAGIALLPSAIAVDAAIVSKNTIDISAGVFDGSKVARALLVV